MQSKLTHSVRRVLRMAIVAVCLLCTALVSQGQSTKKAADGPIIKGAPHLPAMVRSTGEDVIHGENATYALKQNEANILAWIQKYPAEFKAYQLAVQKYLQTVQPESMRSAEKARYYDLKAQWMMIQQMNLTWDTIEIKSNSN